ncbi:hypothetical protein GcM3_182019 [Golovinomyces cichoracearum]|uniref:Uncharacterized protein n=1 Tax=Golovinomyces cichoracearum TaxID=62708 RepID=A0A420HLT3_9PEZI|nr:hypothetical protein GcM3_182019 [Golovinomyces cichoracearum]
MKSQEAAFRSASKLSRKPKKSKISDPVSAPTPRKIKKNAARNERRKAARKTASMLKAVQEHNANQDGDNSKTSKSDKTKNADEL